MNEANYNVLCRSILGEALINHLGAERFRAVSASSHPVGRVNPHAFATLARHGLPTEGYRSQSWEEFENLVQVAVNDLIMLVAFAPIVKSLVSGASGLEVPFDVLLYSVLVFIVIPPRRWRSDPKAPMAAQGRHLVRAGFPAPPPPPSPSARCC